MPTVVFAAFALLTLPWTAYAGFTTTSGSAITGSPSAFEEAQSRFAQPPPPAQQMLFSEMDRNGDGVITRDEWRGVAAEFRENDWNADGVLSGDEVRPGAVRRTPGNGRPRGNQANNADIDRDFDLTVPDEFNDWTSTAFSRLDRNRDGRLTLNEWPYDPDTFQRVDLNRNRVVTSAEFLDAANAYDGGAERFEKLDANRNGRVERNEWRGSASAFTALDRNRDNILTRTEVLGTSAAPTDARANSRWDRFASLDYNRDGAITVDEWQYSRRSFDQRDLNRDGRLTRRELLDTGTNAVPTSGQAAVTPGQTVRVDPLQRWTDTGLYVRAGQTVTFESEGTVRMSDDQNDTASPGGSRLRRLAADALFPRESAGALLGRVGDGAPIFVGGQRSIRVTTNGQLYLGVNDDHLPDNSGEFRVTITVLGR